MAATRLLLLAAMAGAAHAQPQPPEQKAAPQLSERQAKGIAERQRMIACDRQAREAKLPAAKRHEFIRDCVKGDSAAAGGGAKK